MDYWSTLLLFAIAVLSIHYLFRNFNFFKRHGVIHVPSIPILGSLSSIIFRRTSIGDFFQKLYNFEPNAKYIGFYATMQPIFLLRDPEIIKDVLIKNFEAFPNRRPVVEIDDPLLDKNLISLQGQRWRDARTLLSPAFTSSKMKTMYGLMTDCAVDFTRLLSTLSADEDDIDAKDAFTKYTNDVIVTCAYGIKIDTMQNPTNKFYMYGKEAVSFATNNLIRFLLFKSFPRCARILGLRMITDPEARFFEDTIRTTIAARDAENITRPDMIQLMMDIRGKREAERELSIEDMIAHAFAFFLGGFETTAIVISFAAHEIAVNPDVQARLRREIDEVLERSNGEVTYEAINRLAYLDAVLHETLRLYPPVNFLERVCDKEYELPAALPDEKPFTLKRGMIVWMLIYAIHRDEKYYDDPTKFRPERFLDNKMYHNAPYYMPFGAGPRMCIANRFALLEIKVLLFHLLARCELRPCARTTLPPMRFSKKSATLIPENGFWLNVRRRSDMHPTIASIIVNRDTVES